MVVSSVFFHCGDQGVTHWSPEGICLKFVLIYDFVFLLIDPCFSEHAGSELVCLIEGSFVFNDGFVVFAVELVLRFLEVPPIFTWKLKIYVNDFLLVPWRDLSRN